MYHEVAEGLEQHELMIELRNWLNNLKVAGCSVIDAYKPPFYRYDYGTLDRAKRLYFKWLFLPSGILNINTDKFYKREGIGLIDSHCNPESKLLLADGKEILDPNRLELKPFEEYLKNYCDLSWLK